MDDLPTPIRETLAAFARGVRTVLGENLVALYCFGSLCTGDFDAGSSDIDFLAIVDGPLSAGDLAALDALHHRLARASVWGNRLEGG
jgi:predicted nucleotidyltransferase